MFPDSFHVPDFNHVYQKTVEKHLFLVVGEGVFGPDEFLTVCRRPDSHTPESRGDTDLTCDVPQDQTQ